MKKRHLSVALICAVAASLSLSSCIGSFGLTKKVITWNNQVGNKFLNELVFIAFWVLPVYEVTSLADLLVLNSIEFWSGRNPMTASVKTVDTDHGRYLIACDGKGYTVTCQATGEQTRLAFYEDQQTWAVETEAGSFPFMTYVDDTHVRMITPSGSFDTFELSQQGVMAYTAAVNNHATALL